jgi:hypothetical protein
MAGRSVSLVFRIVVDSPVPGVAHSLQSRDALPLNPKVSRKGEALAFDFPVRVEPGPKFAGDQVRREGKERRFVYVRIGQLAGDATSPWSRRMKVDIHDTAADLLDDAAARGAVVEITVPGAGKDGTPACATVPRSTRLRAK